MRKTTRLFLQNFKGAFHSNKPYLIVRANRPSIQFCVILKEYGLINAFREFWGAKKELGFRAKLGAKVFSPKRGVELEELAKGRGRKNASFDLRRSALPDHRRRDHRYLIIWFTGTTIQPGGCNTLRGVGIGRRESTLNRPARVEFLSRPRFLSLRQLYLSSFWNQIFILETPRGLMTFAEARRLGVGGFLIAIFHL